MDSFHHSCIMLFTFSLLLSWSWAASSTTTAPLLPQPSSSLLAADTLRNRGYSIFASLLVSISSTTNFSGTLLAPPDFAFSFASTKILNNHRPPPRPSVPVLLYHTLKPPLILTWPTLSSRDDGDELRTYFNNNCLYLFKNSFASEVSISSSPFKNPIAAVKVRQPDLYVDDHLTVHGIDGVLNPTFGTRCSVTYSDPTADAVPLQVNRVFLDLAMRSLRRKGYHVVASAMSIRRSDLLPLTSVTVLAVSDEHLFMTPGGFHYDFRRHVVPTRQRIADLAKMTADRVELYTLAPNKTVVVESNDGAVTINGVPVGMREVYHNRWMVVISVISSLDDIADPPTTRLSPSLSAGVPSPSPISGVSAKIKSPRAPSPSPASGVSTKGRSHRVPSPAPTPAVTGKRKTRRVPSPPPPLIPGVSSMGRSQRVPSPAPEEFENSSPTLTPEAADEDDNALNSSPPAPEIEGEEKSLRSPVPSPATDDVNVIHCDLNVVVSDGVEGGDLLCPDRMGRTGSLAEDDVEGYQPYDAQSQDAEEDLTESDDVKIAENVNIADDVFFYS
ncbi:hypothetical protein C2S53_016155 [Perilla frutescens var. hirtella]|uniref:Fasciclin-like arabinogalactan protein n=1 Tax=Perilla frutescens var. hirtella TaxID=608512 RepID=A0AAD4J4G4_PERFH|nr:hypothetical protein C2S53_016155 [Perilla frutescens var. hirtella]